MKIKSWLFVSYLIVMILPLLAAYYLFAWINDYNSKLDVKDYFEKWTELQTIIPILEKPELYKVGRDYPELDSIASDKLEINLYLKEGFQIYSSNPLKQFDSTMFINSQRIYEDLYEFEASFNSYSYKQPVLIGSEIVGFFDVKLVRSEWITGISNMSTYVFVAFLIIFISIFSVVVYFVNRKLNKPLKKLIRQMHAFAKNEELETIRISNDEIGELAKSFEEMREQIVTTQNDLKKEQKEKEYMIASISHDLKTPLTSIRAYAEGLTNQENIEDYSNIIIEKSNYMKQMLDDLLMYTLLQSPNYQLNKVEVDGNEFFEMLISDYEVLCKEKRIQLQTICDVSGNFRVAPNQLLRVMDNLMSNAIKHTNSRGNIVLAAVNWNSRFEGLYDFTTKQLKEKRGMYLIVQNSGKGINEQSISKVFKPLYQEDEARTKNGEVGTGLGLSIAKSIIEKHGGTIEVVSKDSVGTSIICWLPSNKGEIDHEK